MYKILLTFDIEEFDLPLEYGINISSEQQMITGKEGLDNIDAILNDPKINCTLFTTANFALKYPSAIAALSKKHEIASHTFFHSSFKTIDLKNSRDTLENITAKKIVGLRMPRMQKISASVIKQAGFIYDSSINPTWIPGKYNNLLKPRIFYLENEIIRLPVSVSANLRIPLFWLSFKNFPYAYFLKIALQTLKKDRYLSLYFHPWEFTNLQSFDLPNYIKKKSGNELLELFERLIIDLKNVGEFITIQSFLEDAGS